MRILRHRPMSISAHSKAVVGLRTLRQTGQRQSNQSTLVGVSFSRRTTVVGRHVSQNNVRTKVKVAGPPQGAVTDAHLVEKLRIGADGVKYNEQCTDVPLKRRAVGEVQSKAVPRRAV